MNTMKAVMNAMAAIDKEPMVFDWDEAARRIVAAGAKSASAGLRSDWEWTGGEILQDGKPMHDSYTYLQSNWAEPELDIDGVVSPCWRLKRDSPGWNSATKWPASALEILGATK